MLFLLLFATPNETEKKTPQDLKLSLTAWLAQVLRFLSVYVNSLRLCSGQLLVSPALWVVVDNFWHAAHASLLKFDRFYV